MLSCTISLFLNQRNMDLMDISLSGLRNWLYGHTQRVAVNSSVSRRRPNEVTFLSSLYQDQYYLTSLLVMWSLRLSTASASFPAVQNRAVNMLWTCQHIQRDLVRLQGWACTKLKKFNNAKYEVLHLSWGSPKHKYRLGREWIESSFEKKDLGLLFHEKLCMKGQCALATQKADFILG